ncbi:MAG: ABC transporter permease [Halobacteriota archaeon]|jgi:ABC-2 type transport system permease protein
MPDGRMAFLGDIYSIWLREMTRYVRARSRVITSLITPLLWLIIFGTGFSSALSVGGTGGSNYINFLAPGILGMVVLFTGMFSGMSVMFDKEFGFLKEILVAPVSRTSIVIGKALGGTTQGAIQGVLIFGLSYFIGVRISGTLGLAGAIVLILVTMFFIGMGFVGLGISIASRIENIEGFQVVMNLLVLPIFFLSGAFFPVTSLPAWMKALVDINPLAYGVDALRYAVTGLHSYALTTDLAVVVGFFVLMMIVGSILFRNVH